MLLAVFLKEKYRERRAREEGTNPAVKYFYGNVFYFLHTIFLAIMVFPGIKNVKNVLLVFS